MKTSLRSAAIATLTVAALTIAAPATAAADQPSTLAKSSFHADFEVDPTAYALSGYSLHVGLGWKRLRLDLGAFAMALPDFAKSDDSFEVWFDGFGSKLQYFVLAEQRGLFLGVDAGVARPLVQRGELASKDSQYSIGVNAGYRFDLGANLYATPWLGVSYAFSAEDVTLGGTTYAQNPVTIFPAVHVGYRFR
ncbi:MAG: hypothetical protein IT370_27295 [Deltaproteobacteria bacterium]|nr:hypothetical protein [Deltaproteobacteria bacterium]